MEEVGPASRSAAIRCAGRAVGRDFIEHRRNRIRIREAGRWRCDRMVRLMGRAPWSTRHGTSRGVWRLNLVHPRSAPDSAPIHQTGPGSQICLRTVPAGRNAPAQPLDSPCPRSPPDRRFLRGQSCCGRHSEEMIGDCRQRSKMGPIRRSKTRPPVRRFLVCRVLVLDAGQRVDPAVA